MATEKGKVEITQDLMKVDVDSNDYITKVEFHTNIDTGGVVIDIETVGAQIITYDEVRGVVIDE